MAKKDKSLLFSGSKTTREAKARFLEALKDALGIVSTASDIAGINRSTAYRWLDSDETLAKEWKDIQEQQKDVVESKMLDKIMKGDSTMMIFYAKTKMKDRGYVERQELTGKDGQPLVADRPKADLSKLTEEQRKVLSAIGMEILNDTKN